MFGVNVKSEKFPNNYFLCSKDVRLPVHLQRAMAAEAEAAREARAKVIIKKNQLAAERPRAKVIIHH